MEYELLFFTSVANEDRIGEIKREIEKIITDQGGKISAEFSDIGKRKFAYPIKKQTHGFYSFCRFSLNKKGDLSEMNRRLALNDKIMRHLIVRADEIGRPIGTQVAREVAPELKAPKVPEKRKEAPDEPEKKVEMEELDEKLSEILDETPE